MSEKEMIRKTEGFLKKKLAEGEYMKRNPSALEYRIAHSYRVANIGKEIAEKEGLDVTTMIIGCLLHDVSYCETFRNEEDWRNHGRSAAKIAKPFLEELGLPEDRVRDILFGIAIHVDDEADFEGEYTVFARTIGEADNIDRFDVYRIYENLEASKFSSLSHQEKTAAVEKTLKNLRSYKDIEMASKTSRDLWIQRLDYYIGFYEKLGNQLKNSTEVHV